MESPRDDPAIARLEHSANVHRAGGTLAHLDIVPGLHRVNPVGRYSRIRACVLKHMGLRLVLEGKHDPDKTYVYVGCDLGVTEQLLIASVSFSLQSSHPRQYNCFT